MSRWCTIAPILPAWRGPSFEVNDPVDLGAGVRFIRTPEWLHDVEVSEMLGTMEHRYVDEARFALSVDYDAESYGEPDPGWTRQVGMSKQDVAAEKLVLADVALWLARPSWLAFKLVFDLQQDEEAAQWVVRRITQKDPARPYDTPASLWPTSSSNSCRPRCHADGALGRVPAKGTREARALETATYGTIAGAADLVHLGDQQ